MIIFFPIRISLLEIFSLDSAVTEEPVKTVTRNQNMIYLTLKQISEIYYVTCTKKVPISSH